MNQTNTFPSTPVARTRVPGSPRRSHWLCRVMAAIAIVGGLCAAIVAPVRADTSTLPLGSLESLTTKTFRDLIISANDEKTCEIADYVNHRTRVDITFFVANKERVASFELYNEHAPKNVANFLRYVEGYKSDKGVESDYINSFIHRLARDFVVQGGGFKYDSTKDPTDYTAYSAVNVIENVPNEFHLHNTRGTISMAKRGGDPNSATSQWFVSLGDNRENLDNQNGGFTVFGRVVDLEAMKIFDDINAIATSDIKDLYDIFLENSEIAGALVHSKDAEENINGGVPFMGDRPVFITKTAVRPITFGYYVEKPQTPGYLSATIDGKTGKLSLKVIGDPEEAVDEVVKIKIISEHANEGFLSFKVRIYPSRIKVFANSVNPGAYTKPESEFIEVDLSQYEDKTPFSVANGEISFDGKKWMKSGKLPANKNEITKIWLRVKGVKTFGTEINGILTIGGEKVSEFVVHTGIPDLAIKKYKIHQPDALPENGKFDVEILVTNLGDSPSNAAKASVYWDITPENSDTGKLNKATKTATLPKINPGDEKTIWLKGIVAKLPKPGADTASGDTLVPAYIVLDAEEKILDRDRSNNAEAVGIQVCQPDVEMPDVWWGIYNSKNGEEYARHYVEYNSETKQGGYYEVRVPRYTEFDFGAVCGNFGAVPSKSYKLNAFYYDSIWYPMNGKGKLFDRANQVGPVKSTSVPKMAPIDFVYETEEKGHYVNLKNVALKKLPNPLSGEFYLVIYLDFTWVYYGNYENGYGIVKTNPRESPAGNSVVIRILKE